MKKLKVFAAPYLVWMAVLIVVPLLMVEHSRRTCTCPAAGG